MHRIAATKVRRDLTEILERVRYANETFIVHKAGRPCAMIVPIPISEQNSVVPDKRRDKKQSDDAA